MNIDGHVALVTGAASGLGAATARHLAALSARVAVLDFNRAGAAEVADEIAGLGVQTDVTDEASVAAALAAVIAHFGAGPRVLVNCAGIADAARIVGREGRLSTELFERVIGVNLIGSYRVMSHAARAMQALGQQPRHRNSGALKGLIQRRFIAATGLQNDELRRCSGQLLKQHRMALRRVRQTEMTLAVALQQANVQAVPRNVASREVRC